MTTDRPARPQLYPEHLFALMGNIAERATAALLEDLPELAESEHDILLAVRDLFSLAGPPGVRAEGDHGGALHALEKALRHGRFVQAEAVARATAYALECYSVEEGIFDDVKRLYAERQG